MRPDEAPILSHSVERQVEKLERQQPEIIPKVMQCFKEGMNGNEIARQLEMPKDLVFAVRRFMDPKDSMRKRVMEWRAWRIRKNERLAAKSSERHQRIQGKKAMEAARQTYYLPGETYDMFVARIRDGRRRRAMPIPLLDYTDEKQEKREEKDRDVEDVSAPKSYRHQLRKLLPAAERAQILARLARSEDDAVALRAMQMLHKIEGVERRAKDPVKDTKDHGPMFNLKGGAGLNLAPVGMAPLVPAAVKGPEGEGH
jgi:hypothetical protein